MKHLGQFDPPLTQNEREAIVDLLELCLFADAHIGQSESKLVADTVETIGWDHADSFECYLPKAIAKARLAGESREQTADFLAFVSMRLKSEQGRGYARKQCARVLAADGSPPVGEMSLWLQIQTALA